MAPAGGVAIGGGAAVGGLVRAAPGVRTGGPGGESDARHRGPRDQKQRGRSRHPPSPFWKYTSHFGSFACLLSCALVTDPTEPIYVVE
ncbi:hypothetical protein GCM10027089_01150 [Nocardia thraciensis]